METSVGDMPRCIEVRDCIKGLEGEVMASPPPPPTAPPELVSPGYAKFICKLRMRSDDSR